MLLYITLSFENFELKSIVVSIALFSSLSRRRIGTRNERLFVSRAKVALAERTEKGYGDENGGGDDGKLSDNATTFPDLSSSRE